MYNKTFWLGFVVIYVVMQILGYLTHNVLLAKHYALLVDVFRPRAEMREMIWMLYVSSAIYLYLFCQLFAVASRGKGVTEGVRFGLLLGLFLSVPASINSYVVYPITPAIAAIWFMTGVISFMIAGAIFAAIYRPSAV
ncbi:MAG TPA: hypothetical protein VE175_14960 [Woeseiaceae bacterium]|jgi:hypothetical protein|nr:hypothetical protein [Woeseiaceae bacterium]